MSAGCFCPPPRRCSGAFSCCVQGSELRDGAPCGTAALRFAELSFPSLCPGLSLLWGLLLQHWSVALAVPGFPEPSPHLSPPCPGSQPFLEMLRPWQGFPGLGYTEL